MSKRKFHVVDGMFQPCSDATCELSHSVAASDAQVRHMLSRTAPYRQWNKKIVELSDKFADMPYGKKARVDSVSFQILNFMSYRPHLAFNRGQLEMIQFKLAEKISNDVIQVVNKTDQRGLERFYFNYAGKTYYGLPELTYTDRHLGKRRLLVSNDELASDEDRVRKTFQRFATQEYEIGHRDPRMPLTPENTVMQPAEINRSYRDNYIFDGNGMPKAPNPDKFAEDPTQFYSEDDLIKLYRSLEARYGSNVGNVATK